MSLATGKIMWPGLADLAQIAAENERTNNSLKKQNKTKPKTVKQKNIFSGELKSVHNEAEAITNRTGKRRVGKGNTCMKYRRIL